MQASSPEHRHHSPVGMRPYLIRWHAVVHADPAIVEDRQLDRKPLCIRGSCPATMEELLGHAGDKTHPGKCGGLQGKKRRTWEAGRRSYAGGCRRQLPGTGNTRRRRRRWAPRVPSSGTETARFPPPRSAAPRRWVRPAAEGNRAEAGRKPADTEITNGSFIYQYIYI